MKAADTIRTQIDDQQCEQSPVEDGKGTSSLADAAAFAAAPVTLRHAVSLRFKGFGNCNGSGESGVSHEAAETAAAEFGEALSAVAAAMCADLSAEVGGVGASRVEGGLRGVEVAVEGGANVTDEVTMRLLVCLSLFCRKLTRVCSHVAPAPFLWQVVNAKGLTHAFIVSFTGPSRGACTAALAAYQAHPAHVALGETFKGAIEDVTVADFWC